MLACCFSGTSNFESETTSATESRAERAAANTSSKSMGHGLRPPRPPLCDHEKEGIETDNGWCGTEALTHHLPCLRSLAQE